MSAANPVAGPLDRATPFDGVTPLDRLQAQADRRPHAHALRTRRRGGWWVQTWSRLAADAQALQVAWRARGLQAGGELLLLGPPSPAAVASLIALPSIGVTVVVAAPASAAEAAAIARATHVLADGTHELERVLRHGGPALRHVIVGDDVAADLGAPSAGASASAGWQLELLPAVLEASRGAATATTAATTGATTGATTTALSPASVGPVAQAGVRIEQPDGPQAVPLGTETRSAVPDLGVDEVVLADLPLHWAAGVGFLLGPWLTLAPTLLLPEPGGDALADRTAWRPAVWLTPPDRLDAFVSAWTGRVPARGLGARLVRGLLRDARHPSLAQRVARRRLRRALAVDRVRLILSEDHGVAATTAGLDALGLPRPTPVAGRTAEAVGAVALPRGVAGAGAGAGAGDGDGEGYRAAWVGSPS